MPVRPLPPEVICTSWSVVLTVGAENRRGPERAKGRAARQARGASGARRGCRSEVAGGDGLAEQLLDRFPEDDGAVADGGVRQAEVISFR